MAVSFSGDNQRAIYRSLGLGFNTGSGCIVGLLKTTQVPASIPPVFASAARVNTITRSGPILYFPSDGTINAQNLSGTNPNIAQITGGAVNNGLWHSFVYNFSQNSGGLNQLFVNGISVGTSNNSEAWSYDGSQALSLANPGDSFWPHYEGELAEIAVFARNLTAREVAAISKGFSPAMLNPITYTPLVSSLRDIRNKVVAITGSPVKSTHPRVIGGCV